MARRQRPNGGKRVKAPVPEAGAAKSGLPMPSPDASTNLVIADIVLRAAGGLLRDRLEKGLIARQHDDGAKARRMVDKRGLASSVLLYGASRLARRSPLGLVVVVGGLAAKVFYDRGKRIEGKRKAKRPPAGES